MKGEELEVLKGAEQTIIKYRPAMCIEAHEIITIGIPEVTQVTGLKQKIIDLRQMDRAAFRDKRGYA